MLESSGLDIRIQETRCPLIEFGDDIRTALLLAHPGHELRLHGLIARTKPFCMILMTGSRSGDSQSRRFASARVLEGLGCSTSFGAVLDRDFYKIVLQGDIAPFVQWIETIARDLVANRIDRLLVDGWQLYSVSHDLTHVMGRLAAQQASRLLGRSIEVFHFEVMPGALAGIAEVGAPAAEILLSDAELDAKLRAIENYPEIAAELEAFRQIKMEEAARVESIFRPPGLEEIIRPPSAPPKYEFYGEQRQAQGIYRDVIRWHHVEEILRGIVSL
jgi:hypothetical protein